jgi:hypothetical protein
MSIYLVDRNLPGITMEQLAAAQQSAIETSRRFSEDGKPVRYIRSVYVPGESHVMCLFESGNEALVRDVNQAAGIPFTRVLEAYDLTP